MRLTLRALNRLPMVRPRITPRFADPYTTVVPGGDRHSPNAPIPLNLTDHFPASASTDGRDVAVDGPQAVYPAADKETPSRSPSSEVLKTANGFSEPALVVDGPAVSRPTLSPKVSYRPPPEEGSYPSRRESTGTVDLGAEGTPGNRMVAPASDARTPFIKPVGPDTDLSDSTSGSEAPQSHNPQGRPPERLPEPLLSSAFPGTPDSPTLLSTEVVRSQDPMPEPLHTPWNETGRTREHHDTIGDLPEARKRTSAFEPMDRSRHSSRPVPAEPVIQVSIGRIEVRAVASSPAPATRPAQRRPVMTLDHYLQQRTGNKG